MRVGFAANFRYELVHNDAAAIRNVRNRKSSVERLKWEAMKTLSRWRGSESASSLSLLER
jgi:hypothetical protein